MLPACSSCHACLLACLPVCMGCLTCAACPPVTTYMPVTCRQRARSSGSFPAPRRATDGSDFTNAMRRLVSIIIGIAIPCIVQLLVFPVFARRQLTERLAAALGESVCLLRDAAASAVHLPKSASSKGGAGGEGAGIGSQAARLQRAQRKVASGMDKLLDPTATVRSAREGGKLALCCSGQLCMGLKPTVTVRSAREASISCCGCAGM